MDSIPTSLLVGFKDAFEFTTKLVAGIAGLCYAFGLLATNLYLMGFAFTDFSILRPRSVFTGGWVLAVFLLSSSPLLVAWYKNRDIATRGGLDRATKYAVAYFAAWPIPWIVLAWLIHVTFVPFDPYTDYQWHSIVGSWPRDCFNAFLFLVLGSILGFALQSTMYAYRTRLLGPLLIVRATVIVLVSLAIISWFDYCILPGISVSLAGAKIAKVMLLTDKSHRSAFEELRIPFNTSPSCPNLSDAVGLVYETEHSLLIQRAGLPPTILDRSHVVAIVHASSLECK